MSERQQILEMLSKGKISVEEAERLLDTVGSEADTGAAVETAAAPAKGKARYLRVAVTEAGCEKVNVKIPLQLVRAGVKLGSLIPENIQAKVDGSLQEKGFEFKLRDIKPETVEELIDGLSEFEVKVDDNGDAVRVYCE